MAIARGSLTYRSGGGAFNFTSSSITPVAANLTLLYLWQSGNTNIPTVTGCNVTWTRFSITNSTNDMQLWYTIGGSPTAGTVTVSGMSSSGGIVIQIFDFSGTVTSSPIRQAKQASGSSTSLSVTLDTNFLSGNAIVGYGVRGSSGTTLTAGTDFTLISTGDNNSRGHISEYQLNKSDDKIVDATVSSSGSWIMSGAEIIAKVTNVERRNPQKIMRVGSRSLA